MTLLEKSVRNFLIWLRDNEHYEAAWLPECPCTLIRTILLSNGKTKQEHIPVYTHFRLKGARQKTVSVAVQEASRDFVDSRTKVADRMFYPNEMGLKIANGEICSGFLMDQTNDQD